MATPEHVSPELIINVLGKEYFTAKKKPERPARKGPGADQNVYITGELFKILFFDSL